MNWSEQDLLNYQRRRETLTPAKKDIKGNSNTAIQNKNALTGKFGANRKGPNKTEMEYGYKLSFEFPNCEISFEGISFRMSNSHRYTPDWIVKSPDGILCVEVKARGRNGFRHASYGRAKLAFDQCKKEFPQFQWRFAEKHLGSWNI